MNDAYSAADIAAILENFREQERAAAVFETRRQKVVFTRNLGSGQQLVCQTSLEAVIDQHATTDEIYQLVSRFDEAIDRHKAKIDLAEHYARLDMKIRELDVAIRGRAEREVTYRADNAAKSQNRRVAIVMTSAQEADLKNASLAINECRKQIEAAWENVAIAKAIMRDGNPFEHVEADLRAREVSTMGRAA
jgi:hypothetical protein